MTVSLGASALTTPLSGCAAVQNVLKSVGYVDPKVEIVDMSVTKWGLTSLGTTFDVAVTNPNPVGFTLRGIQYGLDIDGHRLTSGRSQTPVEIAAQGKATTKLAFDFPLAQTANALVALLTKQEVDYGLESSFAIGRPDFAVDVPVEKKGKLPLPRLPRFDVPTAKFTGASLAGVQFRVVPTLENLNAFDLPIEGFETSLRINDRPIINNRASSGGTLRAKAKTPVPIDLNLSLADLGLSAISLMQRPQMRWAVDFSLLAGSLKLPFSGAGQLRLG
ncbi:MAG: LEA type 2 family protein [Myxococcota bacterium]